MIVSVGIELGVKLQWSVLIRVRFFITLGCLDFLFLVSTVDLSRLIAEKLGSKNSRRLSLIHMLCIETCSSNIILWTPTIFITVFSVERGHCVFLIDLKKFVLLSQLLLVELVLLRQGLSHAEVRVALGLLLGVIKIYGGTSGATIVDSLGLSAKKLLIITTIYRHIRGDSAVSIRYVIDVI